MSNLVAALLNEVEQLTKQDQPEELLFLEKCRLDLSKPNPDPQKLISINGLPVCTRGNFSIIIGLPGARKSFLSTAIGGCYLSKDGFLGMENANGTGVLLWVDTEQSNGHVARIGRRLHRIAGLPVEYNNNDVIILMLREYPPQERRRITDLAINSYRPDFIIIDGLSDLITDPNNTEQSSDIVSYLMAVTKNNDCHILTVIHANIGNDKARGHLGAEALRKCETAITITAEKEYSVCTFSKSRDIKPDDFAFTVNSKGLPETVAINQTQPAKAGRLTDLFNQIIPLPSTVSYADLVAKVMAVTNVKDRMAKRKISDALEEGIIEINNAGYYHLKQQEIISNELPF